MPSPRGELRKSMEPVPINKDCVSCSTILNKGTTKNSDRKTLQSAHLEKGDSFGTALRHDECVFGIPRESQCHNDEELDRTDQKKFVNLVFSVNWKERPTCISPRKGFFGFGSFRDLDIGR